ncbi:hypothetical protein DMN91_005607 [Ooceraea biroi]|uniref:Uncharacterized protein n=1 Tax=Ooceraea biroi TaxID=2015173 RepID=A0A3L8DLC1_OOCBI|nr:hypothetical protein DMN91_005607 [Ooceraea biroi]
MKHSFCWTHCTEIRATRIRVQLRLRSWIVQTQQRRRYAFGTPQGLRSIQTLVQNALVHTRTRKNLSDRLARYNHHLPRIIRLIIVDTKRQSRKQVDRAIFVLS